MKIYDGELEIVNDKIYYCPEFGVLKLRKVVINNEVGYLTDYDLEIMSHGDNMGFSSLDYLKSIDTEVYNTFEEARLKLREYTIKSVQNDIKYEIDSLIKNLAEIDLLKE